MKFLKIVVSLLAFNLNLLPVLAQNAAGANDFAPTVTPQKETPGSLPPPGLENGGSGGQLLARHHKGQGNPQKRQQRLAQFDTNGDGQLDQNEKAAARAARGARKQGGAGKRAGGGGGKRGGKGHSPADKAARRQKMMARFDTNGDGTLDPGEKAAAQAFRQQRKQQRMMRKNGGALPQS